MLEEGADVRDGFPDGTSVAAMRSVRRVPTLWSLLIGSVAPTAPFLTEVSDLPNACVRWALADVCGRSRVRFVHQMSPRSKNASATSNAVPCRSCDQSVIAASYWESVR